MTFQMGRTRTFQMGRRMDVPVSTTLVVFKMNRICTIRKERFMYVHFSSLCPLGLVQSQQWKRQNNLWNLFKLTINTLERRHRSGAFIANYEQISRSVQLFPLLSLNKYIPGEIKSISS